MTPTRVFGSTVLLVEDDPAIARTIIYALERDGLVVTHCLLLGDARLKRPCRQSARADAQRPR